MLHRILIGLARFAIGEVSKKIAFLFLILTGLAVLVAVFVFNWHSSNFWAFKVVLVIPLPFLVIWFFLRCYLLVHPLAGDEKYDNYFIKVSSDNGRRQLSWQKGDFYWINGSFLEAAPFSIFKLVPSDPARRFFRNIEIYELPFGDSMPSTFPFQVMLQVNFFGPYCQEEVLALMVDISGKDGVLYHSYEDYLKQSFSKFLQDSSSLLKNGFFLQEEIVLADSFAVSKRLGDFFRENFLPPSPSNVKSFSFSFSLKD